MERVSIVRLLSMAVTVALDELHEELARRGHPNLRPVHGYALNAVSNGADTASTLAPVLSMTKQGAANVVQLLLEEGYLIEVADLTDPAGQGVDAVRPIRDDIEQRVRTLLASLEVPVA